MTDEFTLDFSDVTASSFDPIPAGWYKFVVTDYNDVETKNKGKTLDAGTPGTNWEFTCDEGDYENRKVWTNHWHHPSTLGQMKAMFAASGAFTDEELAGSISLDDRDKVIGKAMWLKLKVRRSEQYGDSNDVQGYKHEDARSASTGASSPASGIMP